MRRSQNSLNETQMCGSNLSQILDWKEKLASNYRHKGLHKLFSIFWWFSSRIVFSRLFYWVFRLRVGRMWNWREPFSCYVIYLKLIINSEGKRKAFIMNFRIKKWIFYVEYLFSRRMESWALLMVDFSA